MNKCRTSFISILAWLWLSGMNIHGIVVTLNPSEDTSITQKDSTTSPSTDDTIYTGTNNQDESSRALMKFNVAASIPSDAIIVSASLTITVLQVPPEPRPDPNPSYNLHRVLRAWSESDATWSIRLAPSIPWDADGATAEIDYSSVVSQTTNNILIEGNIYTFVSNANMISDAQGWASNSSSNLGWILICASQGIKKSVRTFGSRENSSIANRPLLTIDYMLPAVATTLTPLPLSSNQISFSFNAESNRTYTVEFLGELQGTNWTALTNIPAQPASTNVIVSDFLSNNNRFYRVRMP